MLTVAARHGLSPLVYPRVRGAVEAAPSAFVRELRERYLSSAAANMRLLHELGVILRTLRAADVPVIPLKGACLAEAVYGDIALRPMADLDLLVKPADLPRALEALRQLGYESDQPFDPGAQQAEFHDMPPMRKAGCVLVELHWTLVTPRCNARIGQAELEGIWSRAVAATVAGEPARLLRRRICCCIFACTHRFTTGSQLLA